MFLSTYENKLDKKGRVSVPASFRSHLSNLGYNGVICYPSFNNTSIEACSQDRIEKISSAIDSLNPFEEKRDFFATSILADSTNLQFDSEGRIACCLLVKVKLSKFGNQQFLKNLRSQLEKKQISIELVLNGKNILITTRGNKR